MFCRSERTSKSERERERDLVFARTLSRKHSSTVNVNGACFKSFTLNQSSNSLTMCTLKFELKVISICIRHNAKQTATVDAHRMWNVCKIVTRLWTILSLIVFLLIVFFFIRVCIFSLPMLVWCAGTYRIEKNLYKTMAWLEHFATRNSIYTHSHNDMTLRWVFEICVLFFSHSNEKPKWMLKADNLVHHHAGNNDTNNNKRE